jgi:hypothetical protein
MQLQLRGDVFRDAQKKRSRIRQGLDLHRAQGV